VNFSVIEQEFITQTTIFHAVCPNPLTWCVKEFRVSNRSAGVISSRYQRGSRTHFHCFF